MGADVGDQIVTIRFKRPVDSDIVNKRFVDIRQLGIWKGGYLTKTGGDNVSLSPLVCEISDGTHQVRVETTIAVTKTMLEAAPYLVLTWAYSGIEDTDYMVITTSSLPDTNDLIIAKGIFVASALSSIDYSERTNPSTHALFLRVEEMETPSSTVRIRAGVGHGASIHSVVVDRTLTISGVSTGETVYIYVTDSGGVTYSKVAATYAGKALLAKIVWPADGIIENSDIIDVRSFITPPAIPDESTITRNSVGKLQIKDFGITSIYGPRTRKDSTDSNLVIDAVYKATSDGEVTAAYTGASNDSLLKAYNDTNNPPTTFITAGSARNIPYGTGLSFIVAKDEYWKITGNTPSYIGWRPIGSGVCIKQ